jgi:hypothetical protein
MPRLERESVYYHAGSPARPVAKWQEDVAEDLATNPVVDYIDEVLLECMANRDEEELKGIVERALENKDAEPYYIGRCVDGVDLRELNNWLRSQRIFGLVRGKMFAFRHGMYLDALCTFRVIDKRCWLPRSVRKKLVRLGCRTNNELYWKVRLDDLTDEYSLSVDEVDMIENYIYSLVDRYFFLCARWN